MGRPTRPLHDPGNHGTFERRSLRQAARRGRLTSRPRRRSRRPRAPTPRLGTRSSSSAEFDDGPAVWSSSSAHSTQVVEKRPNQVAELVGETPPSLDRCWTLDDDLPDCIGVGCSLTFVDLPYGVPGGTVSGTTLELSAAFESVRAWLGLSSGAARSSRRCASETVASK